MWYTYSVDEEKLNFVFDYFSSLFEFNLFILFTNYGPKTDNSKTASHEKYIPIFSILVVMVIVSNTRKSFVIISLRTVCLCLRRLYFRTDRRGNYKLEGKINMRLISQDWLLFPFSSPELLPGSSEPAAPSPGFYDHWRQQDTKEIIFSDLFHMDVCFFHIFFCLLPQVINSQPTKPRKKTVIPL